MKTYSRRDPRLTRRAWEKCDVVIKATSIVAIFVGFLNFILACVLALTVII